MKTIQYVFLFTFFMLGVTVFAQQNIEPKGNGSVLSGQEPKRGILGRLNLSDEQQTKLNDIRKEYHLKDSVAFADFRNEQEQKRIEELNAFKSILNKDQLDQLEKSQKNREYFEIFNDCKCPERLCMSNHCPMGMTGPERMMEGKVLSPENHAQRQTEQLTKELNLTEKQIAKIQEINLKYAQKEYEKQGPKCKRVDLRTARQKDIISVLNKEQKEKYENLLKKNQQKSRRFNIEHGQQPQPMR